MNPRANVLTAALLLWAGAARANNFAAAPRVNAGSVPGAPAGMAAGMGSGSQNLSFSQNPGGLVAPVSLDVPALDRAPQGQAAVGQESAAAVPLAAPRADALELPPSLITPAPVAQEGPRRQAYDASIQAEEEYAAQTARASAGRTASSRSGLRGARPRLPEALVAFRDRMSRAARLPGHEASASATIQVWDGGGERSGAVDARSARGNSLLAGRLTPPAPAGAKAPELLALRVSDLSLSVDLARPSRDLRLAAGLILLPLAGAGLLRSTLARSRELLSD